MLKVQPHLERGYFFFAYRIIEDTLNLRDTRIFDCVYDEHSNKKAVFNAKETTAAQAKQEVIKLSLIHILIREIESPKGYVLSEEEIAVTIGKVDEVVAVSYTHLDVYKRQERFWSM